MATYTVQARRHGERDWLPIGRFSTQQHAESHAELLAWRRPEFDGVRVIVRGCAVRTFSPRHQTTTPKKEQTS